MANLCKICGRPAGMYEGICKSCSDKGVDITDSSNQNNQPQYSEKGNATLTLLLSFEGRINRQPFLYLLIVIIIGAALTLAIDIWLKDKLLVTFIFSLIITWPYLAMQVKRWHDRDKSGWWVFISIIPYIGPIWMLIECCLLEGTKGPNRYGDNPLDSKT